MSYKKVGQNLSGPIISVDAVHDAPRSALADAIELCMKEQCDVNLRMVSGVTIRIGYEESIKALYIPLLDKCIKAERDSSDRLDALDKE
jgi:hypothetical protein